MVKKIVPTPQQLNELNRLKTKYFWQQKFNEVGTFIAWAAVIFLVLATIYNFSYGLITEDCSQWEELDFPSENLCISSHYVLAGLITIIISFFGFLILIGIIKGILAFGDWLQDWIEENKEKAELRARQELGLTKRSKIKTWRI